jgi:hypothetical protein
VNRQLFRVETAEDSKNLMREDEVILEGAQLSSLSIHLVQTGSTSTLRMRAAATAHVHSGEKPSRPSSDPTKAGFA